MKKVWIFTINGAIRAIYSSKKKAEIDQKKYMHRVAFGVYSSEIHEYDVDKKL